MPDDPGAPAPDPTTPDPAPTADPGDLGDAGQKALSEERKARRAAEQAAKKLQAELDKVTTANQSEAEKALAAARLEGAQEATLALTKRLVRSEIAVAAAGKLQDPEDAYGFLDEDSFVDATGEIDQKAITSAIDELVKQKPYLAASATPQQPGTGGGGARQAPMPLNGDPLERSLKEKLGIR